MEFIKAQDLKTVANILKELQFDVMTSAMAGCVRTQNIHKLNMPDVLINHIKQYFTDIGYKVVLHQGNNQLGGEPYTLITLFWGE